MAVDLRPSVLVCGTTAVEYVCSTVSLPASPGRAPVRLVTSRRQVCGGAAPLAAREAARAGVRTVVSTLIGDDADGAWCQRAFDGANIDVGAIVSAHGPTTQRILRCSPNAQQPIDERLLEDPSVEAYPEPVEELVIFPGVTPLDPHHLRSAAVATWQDRGLMALSTCHPGDVLLIDGLVLAACPGLLEAAFEADLQIVGDLRPFPALGPGLGTLIDRLDVAVVDPDGAGLLADSATMPISTLVLAGAGGACWDDLEQQPPLDPWAPAVILSSPENAHHAFCGALAAALAAGADRPEALDAALSVWANAAARGFDAPVDAGPDAS